jgi:hypothetical protein
MPRIATVDKDSEKSCEATGHPSECTEPVPGPINKTDTHNVNITTASNVTKQIATIQSSEMFFPKHDHDYGGGDGCHDEESHTLDPEIPKTASSGSITINQSPVYIVEDDVTKDPKTDEKVNIVKAGINNSVNNSKL